VSAGALLPTNSMPGCVLQALQLLQGWPLPTPANACAAALGLAHTVWLGLRLRLWLGLGALCNSAAVCAGQADPLPRLQLCRCHSRVGSQDGIQYKAKLL
jgi:hypothetical protein